MDLGKGPGSSSGGMPAYLKALSAGCSACGFVTCRLLKLTGGCVSCANSSVLHVGPRLFVVLHNLCIVFDGAECGGRHRSDGT